MEEMIIIETVDDGVVGYMNADGVEEDYEAVETIEEHVDEPAGEFAEQVVEQHTVETLPVVYVAEQLPNTGTYGYEYLTIAGLGLVFLGIVFLKKALWD